jgi:hypothetical protein
MGINEIELISCRSAVHTDIPGAAKALLNDGLAFGRAFPRLR